MQKAVACGRLGAHQGGGGGVVVDSSSDTVIAVAHSTNNHPLRHTVINLVDLVARTQGGGAIYDRNYPETFYCIEEIFTTTKSTVHSETISAEEDGQTSHNHLKRFGSIAQLSSVPKTGPYLCTGYDVYLSHEPCHMCAMALIHMRTRRVFYREPSRDGALGTCDKIHTLSGLNHRYEVFQGVLWNCEDDASLENCC